MSTTTATATAIDVLGNPIAGHNVTITSNGGQSISAVTDNGDGTYTATITSTTTVGTSTITATDHTASVQGTATLTQTRGPATSLAVKVMPASIVADGASRTTATVTAADALGHPAPGDTVTVAASDPGVGVGPVADQGNGTYLATVTSSTVAHQVTITASDTTVSPAISSSTALTQTPGAAAVITISLSPTSIPADGSSGTTATALITDANGNPVPGQAVMFSSSDPGETIGATADVGNGSYTAMIKSSTAAGQATIVATDTSSMPSLASPGAILTQTLPQTQTTLTTAPLMPTTNQPTTLIATVTSSAASIVPSGTLTFENGGAPIPGCSTVAVTASGQSATVTCQTSFAAATSPEQLSAAFAPTPGADMAASTGALAITVAPDSTSTMLQSPSGKTGVAAKLTFAATVSPAHSGAATPSGSIQFILDGAPVKACAQRPLTQKGTAAAATCTLSFAKVHKHVLGASYAGDVNFGGSDAAQLPVSVVSGAAGTITSTMQWTFLFAPAYTRVLTLLVNGAPVGATVLVKCSGGGCPFPQHVTRVRAAGCKRSSERACRPPSTRAIDLLPPFRRRHLRPGAQIVVEVVRSGYVGKYYRFTVRRRRAPLSVVSCLAPGTSRPGVGC